MSKIIAILCILLSFTAFSQDKHSFELNKTQDIALTATGFISIASAYFIKQHIQPLSTTQALNLNSNQVSAFDRPAIGYHSTTALHLSDIGQYASLALPFSVFAFQPSKKELFTQLIMLQEVAFITTGVTHITKGLIQRPRPYTYRNDASLELQQSIESRASFFSGHTAISAAMSFYAASVIATYSDNATLKTTSWIAAAILPATVGYLRVRAGEHFYTDIITGYLIGGGIGWLIPKLHLTKNENIQLYPFLTPTSNGIGFCMKL